MLTGTKTVNGVVESNPARCIKNGVTNGVMNVKLKSDYTQVLGRLLSQLSHLHKNSKSAALARLTARPAACARQRIHAVFLLQLLAQRRKVAFAQRACITPTSM